DDPEEEPDDPEVEPEDPDEAGPEDPGPSEGPDPDGEPDPGEESGDEDWRSRISMEARSGSGWPRAVRRRSGMW
ncbi:hypothetical protein GTW29_19270, partial [Streptomyces sp. SID7834]|nr:hypothetical protein [Streptomyces sp. SID7834]